MKFHSNVANQYKISNITYSAIEGKYLNMLGHKKEIIYDLDGSFTNEANFDSNNRQSAAVVSNWVHLQSE